MVEKQPRQQSSQNMESKINKNNNYHLTFILYSGDTPGYELLMHNRRELTRHKQSIFLSGSFLGELYRNRRLVRQTQLIGCGRKKVEGHLTPGCKGNGA